MPASGRKCCRVCDSSGAGTRLEAGRRWRWCWRCAAAWPTTSAAACTGPTAWRSTWSAAWCCRSPWPARSRRCALGLIGFRLYVHMALHRRRRPGAAAHRGRRGAEGALRGLGFRLLFTIGIAPLSAAWCCRSPWSGRSRRWDCWSLEPIPGLYRCQVHWRAGAAAHRGCGGAEFARATAMPSPGSIQ